VSPSCKRCQLLKKGENREHPASCPRGGNKESNEAGGEDVFFDLEKRRRFGEGEATFARTFLLKRVAGVYSSRITRGKKKRGLSFLFRKGGGTARGSRKRKDMIEKFSRSSLNKGWKSEL